MQFRSVAKQWLTCSGLVFAGIKYTNRLPPQQICTVFLYVIIDHTSIKAPQSEARVWSQRWDHDINTVVNLDWLNWIAISHDFPLSVGSVAAAKRSLINQVHLVVIRWKVPSLFDDHWWYLRHYACAHESHDRPTMITQISFTAPEGLGELFVG